MPVVDPSLRAFLLAVAVVGCDAIGRRAECEPVTGEGCGDGQRCVVSAEGDPACRSPSEFQLDDGDPCATDNACPERSGCVSIDGRAQCLPFCEPDLAGGASRCAAWHRDARCLGTVALRPEIGVCVRPCRDPQIDCAAFGEPLPGCFFPPGLDVALCAGLTGDADVGDFCDFASRCRSGLLCVPRGAGGLCRRPASRDELTCEVGQEDWQGRPRSVPGTTFYAVCEPCLPIGGPMGLEPASVSYVVCVEPVTETEAERRCETLGGELATPTETLAGAAFSALGVGPLTLSTADGCLSTDGETFEPTSDCGLTYPVCRLSQTP
ncbi:MAG: hypothetical protein EXR76_14305 [Myxococcales bacterium]|nr:hypothetical protein [Myxococcales bacterium]